MENTKMLDTLSTDALTNDILKAIVRRTYTTIRAFNESETVELFEGKNFTWSLDDNLPTMSVELPDNSNPSFVHLWWNKQPDDDKMEVFSNIPFTARENLKYFTTLENLIYHELIDLNAKIPPCQVMLDDLVEEFEDEQE
jgi:hypothetical protein